MVVPVRSCIQVNPSQQRGDRSLLWALARETNMRSAFWFMCSALEKAVSDRLWNKKEPCVPARSWRRDGILAVPRHGLFSINPQSNSYPN